MCFPRYVCNSEGGLSVCLIKHVFEAQLGCPVCFSFNPRALSRVLHRTFDATSSYKSSSSAPEVFALCLSIIAIQGGAPQLAKLVYNSHNYGLW